MAVPQPIAPTPAETALEAHLRHVIESQPVCLTRLAEDGTFLAVNDAALHLLGAERLDQVLATSFLTLLEPEYHDDARAFLSRMAGGERGSLEVVMTALEGPPRTMQVHGVGMKAPIDGLRSVLCTLRDVTEIRRLEQALVDGAVREDSLKAALATEREGLATAVDQARQQQAAAVEGGRVAEIEAQLAAAVAQHVERERALQADLQSLRSAIEAAAADHLARVAQADAARDAAEAQAREAAERLRADEAHWKKTLDETTGAHSQELATLRAAVGSLETAVQEATARERDVIALYDAEKARWQKTAAEAAAAHEQELSAVRALLTSLENAVDEAAARERDVVALYESEKARWQKSADEAAAAHEQELTSLRGVVSSLENAVDEAAARERDVVGLYETEKARWQEAQAEAAARLQAEHDRWSQRLDEATRALAGAQAESRALEAQWQHASRLADAARLTASVASDLETALAMTSDGARRLLAAVPEGEQRTIAEQALGAALEATLLARQLRRRGVPAPVLALTPAVQRLEPVLGAMLQPGVTLAVLAAGDVDACVQPDDFEQLLMLLVTAQRAAMRKGGSASLEIAEVSIDEIVARERGVRPGPYALLALHASGNGLDDELPDAAFAPSVPAHAWAAAGPAFAAVQRMVAAAGGHMWASREGRNAVALELYLPRAAAPGDITAQEAGS